ncbi:MAG: DUF2271 domain-containing protein [Pseudomonadaceae bacterium]|nr:MAG: DUF2271 domain-containing protein [Pseudomonadaceae bacterium]
MIRSKLTLATLCTLVMQPVLAADLTVDIEVPAFDASDYRRPYVAVWLERPDNSVAANLAVWYDIDMRDAKGTEWLKDMRLWWRRTGRDLEVPVDGLTSATRPPGMHTLTFSTKQAPLSELDDGEYRLIIEASREHGGREVVSLPVQWPLVADDTHRAKGEHELGQIIVRLAP